MELTKKQIKTLEDVFNYAVNALDEADTEGYLLQMDENGCFEKFDKDKKQEDIFNLWEYMKKQITIKEELK